ncbi:MAG TPA: hypothetical protein VNO55_00865 [Polyangia bacterium]|nr:hypothetical protein [Polyangia bacterium]
MKRALVNATALVAISVGGGLGCSNAPTEIIRVDAGGSGGATPGSGGSTGSGGATPGSGGSTGSGGTTIDGPAEVAPETGGGSGGSGGAPATSICTPSADQFDCNNVLSGMDGYLNNDVANGPPQGSDGLQVNCTTSDVQGQQKVFKEKHWQLTGPGITMGKMYKVNLHFYGVVECKTYVGGTGPAKTDPNETPNVSQTHNLWLAGSRDNGDHWNTYAFTVTPTSLSTLVGIGPQNVPLPQTADTYVINQCPGARAEGHFTFNIDYDASLTVPGGSFINYIEYDTNCRIIVNCGAADSAQSCAGPYNLVPTVTKAIPNTNANFTQPPANAANPPARGQWWLVDVTSVTAL